MKIYLVRHGLTPWNKAGRYAGWSDVPLSPEGAEQAERLARYFAGLAPFALFSSDLSRALCTAEMIGRSHGVAPVVLPSLRELFFGEWEGKCYSELGPEYADRMSRWLADPFTCGPPGGETAAQLAQRAWAGFAAVCAAKCPAHTAVVVSHGGPIRAILHRCLGLEADKFWNISVDNASISLVKKVGHTFHVLFQGCRRHLDGVQEAGPNFPPPT